MRKLVVYLFIFVGLLMPSLALGEIHSLPAEVIDHWDPARAGEQVLIISYAACEEALMAASAGDILAVETPNFLLPLRAVQAATEKKVMIGGTVAYSEEKRGVHGFEEIGAEEVFARFPEAQLDELYIGAYAYTLGEEESAPYIAEYEARGMTVAPPVYAIGFAYVWDRDGIYEFVYPETTGYPLCIYTEDYDDPEDSKAFYHKRYLRAWNGDLYRAYGSIGIDKQTGLIANESSYRFGYSIETNAALSPMPYTDVKGHPAAEAIEWAYDIGLLINWEIDGSMFRPDDAMTLRDLLRIIMAYNVTPPADVSDEARRSSLMEKDAFAESLYLSEDADLLGAYLMNFPAPLRDWLNEKGTAYEPGLFSARGWVGRFFYTYFANHYEPDADSAGEDALAAVSDLDTLPEADRSIAAFCLKNGLLSLDTESGLRWDQPMTRGELCAAMRAFEQAQSDEFQRLYSTEDAEYRFY